ncbi:DNA helicase [Solibacillus sp. FSL K6-1523]|uniref:DNA helicase n=1 Tax=Solibacillus sp. FSL K6-1523 TaxID=2921471 RepID=UPI0030F6B9FC
MAILSTALLVTIYFVGSIKLLHLFHMIKWSPVKFMKKWEFIHPNMFERWLIFFIGVFVIVCIVYFLARTIIGKSPFAFSLIAGLLIAILLEFRILHLPMELNSIKKLSIPFIIIVIIGLRVLTETAQYYRLHLTENSKEM